jgi:hypothetical protein
MNIMISEGIAAFLPFLTTILITSEKLILQPLKKLPLEELKSREYHFKKLFGLGF